MPAYARREIVDDTEVAVYHCVSRCVRRAFLCGTDVASGKNFDHRKTWLQDRLEQLASIFAVDLLGFSIMGNHIHLLCRTRPDLADAYCDEEVALRWYRLHPLRRNGDGRPAEPEPGELAMMQADAARLGVWRARLASLSWFMGSLCEPIARRANAEDDCTGRFWEGRFRSQKIADESALLACSIYIDLNPIRACLAETPETSEFTAAFERIAARQIAQRPCATDRGLETPSGPAEVNSAAELPVVEATDGWLSPVPDADVPLSPALSPVAHSNSARLARRASDRGFLPMTLDEYLALLDWTGRMIRSDKRGAIPATLAPILERLQVNAEAWVSTIERFGRAFHRVVGRASSLASLAAARGLNWYQGVSASRMAFG